MSEAYARASLFQDCCGPGSCQEKDGENVSVLKAEKITKQYPGTKALDAVSVEFESGQVHALIGKNGSGKSTLVKIFSGAVDATEGSFSLDGKTLEFHSPQDALDNGIVTVYQELSLVPGLTVAENILMGRMPMKGKFIDWKAAYRQAEFLRIFMRSWRKLQLGGE